jgi:hypothetical protein
MQEATSQQNLVIVVNCGTGSQHPSISIADLALRGRIVSTAIPALPTFRRILGGVAPTPNELRGITEKN